jgi:hypothetical protein
MKTPMKKTITKKPVVKKMATGGAIKKVKPLKKAELGMAMSEESDDCYEMVGWPPKRQRKINCPGSRNKVSQKKYKRGRRVPGL